jgi:hypothetical protein
MAPRIAVGEGDRMGASAAGTLGPWVVGATDAPVAARGVVDRSESPGITPSRSPSLDGETVEARGKTREGGADHGVEVGRGATTAVVARDGTGAIVRVVGAATETFVSRRTTLVARVAEAWAGVEFRNGLDAVADRLIGAIPLAGPVPGFEPGAVRACGAATVARVGGKPGDRPALVLGTAAVGAKP